MVCNGIRRNFKKSLKGLDVAAPCLQIMILNVVGLFQKIKINSQTICQQTAFQSVLTSHLKIEEPGPYALRGSAVGKPLAGGSREGRPWQGRSRPLTSWLPGVGSGRREVDTKPLSKRSFHHAGIQSLQYVVQSSQKPLQKCVSQIQQITNKGNDSKPASRRPPPPTWSRTVNYYYPFHSSEGRRRYMLITVFSSLKNLNRFIF